jgi:hypothetical protein
MFIFFRAIFSGFDGVFKILLFLEAGRIEIKSSNPDIRCWNVKVGGWFCGVWWSDLQ